MQRKCRQSENVDHAHNFAATTSYSYIPWLCSEIALKVAAKIALCTYKDHRGPGSILAWASCAKTQPRSQGFHMRTRRDTRKPWSGPVNFAF